MSCNGVCSRYKVTKPYGSRYLAGQKRCRVCSIFLNWDGLLCPCCNFKLRVNPRYKDAIGKSVHNLK